MKRMSFAYNGFFKELTEENAYWLGLLAADGCLERRRYKRVSLGLKKQDRYIVNKFKTIVGCCDLKTSVNKNSGFSSISIQNANIFDDLIKLGLMPRKSRKLSASSVPNRHLRHFVRGVFDGDGSIGLYRRKGGHRKRAVFSIYGHRPFLRALQIRIKQETGISLTLDCNRKKAKVYVLRASNVSLICRLRIWLYRSSTSFMKRKRCGFDVVKQWRRELRRTNLVREEYRASNFVNGRRIGFFECENCEKEFKRRLDAPTPKYCSRKCSADSSKDPNIVKRTRSHQFINHNCNFCNRSYLKRTDQKGFCSRKCSAQFHSKEKSNACKAL